MNTENIRKPYRSCHFLESGIAFMFDRIACCCDRPTAATIQPIADVGKTVDAFLAMREHVIHENQRNDSPPPCVGCEHFREYKPTNGDIQYMNLGNHVYCNFSCIYCLLQSPSARKNVPEAYDALAIAEELKRRGLLSKTLRIFCDPGEISIHPRRDEYYDFVEENAESVFFFSNVGKFDPRLAHILSLSPRNNMTVSIDCGTEATFRRIRGVDMFKQVVANLAEYRKYTSNISLKYILLDENCNDEDLDGFIRMCKGLKPAEMIIAGDAGKVWIGGSQWSSWDMSLREEHIVNAAVKLAEAAKKNNIDFFLHNNLGQANIQEIYRRLADPENASPQDNLRQTNLQESYCSLAANPEVVSAEQQLDTVLSASKVVCYGAGVNCKNILNQIESLGLRKPDVIWDIRAAPGQKFHTADCEYPVCYPDFNSLNDSVETGVFIAITNTETNQELAQNMKKHGFSNLLMYDQLYLALIAKRAKILIQNRSDK